ncbi:putative adhesin [Chondromyces crocatus]|uniref:Putative adhesin Stv domain-containing protein n=1 Tax=Chondromyces crocatus TaxID=52 RepID=A0A0K1ECE4_CHOCO|nr:hypothetical protein [Chondromyces crocatus]AKT38540.1 uncharacterized protein CMC5_026870 [Chondromyces crocatus]
MAGYIVSGHGGRYTQPGQVTVPAGFSVVFFEEDNRILYNEDAWPIYNHLLSGDEGWVQSRVKHTYQAGDTLNDYACWKYPELTRNSGIFKVGAFSSSNPAISLDGYNYSSPLMLSELFTQLSGSPGTIYWVACTEAS